MHRKNRLNSKWWVVLDKGNTSDNLGNWLVKTRIWLFLIWIIFQASYHFLAIKNSFHFMLAS